MIILEVDNRPEFNISMVLQTLEVQSTDTVNNFVIIKDSYLTYANGSSKQDLTIQYSTLDMVNIYE